jgi:hypothetical protein
LERYDRTAARLRTLRRPAVEANGQPAGVNLDPRSTPFDERETIRARLNALIERERSAEPREADEEAAVWVKKLEECTRLRSAYQDQQAAGS